MVPVRRWGLCPGVLILLCACTQTVSGNEEPGDARRPPGRPNILLIVADDLGYTDIGPFGGEIETPNLDRLANDGLLLTQFHTTPSCSPTRAALLSGVDPHRAGLGWMLEWMHFNAPQLIGQPGYEGHLNFRVASLAELLRDAGYHTYMSGKWHLGKERETGPAARGFERSFALLNGAGGHFDDLGPLPPETKAAFRRDGEPATVPGDFYSSRSYTDQMIRYLRDWKGDDQPFFAYVAYTAPHWPLQAPADSIERQRGRYDAGYEALLEKRLARMKELGLIDPDAGSPPPGPGYAAWSSLTGPQRLRESRVMEIYAAMIGDMDEQVGRLVGVLEEIGAREDTIIFFMSDNGAEGGTIDTVPGLRDWVNACCDNHFENLGRANSFVMLGPGWARASSGPSRLFKGFTTEGGILVPAIVNYARIAKPGRRHDGLLTVLDVLPTLLELAGVQHPPVYDGRDIFPVQGVSFAPLLRQPGQVVHASDEALGWELFGRGALRTGNWKIVRTPRPIGDGQWELFNLEEDPAEMIDLSHSEPARLRTMLEQWSAYSRENGVLSLEEIEALR